MKKAELFKASGAIHLSHNITKFQLKLWNLLIANAQQKNNEKTHLISLIKISKTFNVYNRNYIRDSLNKLTKTIKFNILQKYPIKELKATPLIFFLEIKKGKCLYSFGKNLHSLIFSPIIYTKIDLNIEKKLKSKYGIILYELSSDYRKIKQTPWLNLDLIKTYMCGKNKKIKFKRFSDKVLKTAIKDVNTYSPFKVNIIYQREEKKVTHVKFLIETKEEVKFKPAKFARKNIEANDIITSLEAISIPKEKAWKLYNAYSEDVIKNSIKLLKHNSNIQKINNPAGWLYKAIQEGWAKESIPVKKEPVVIPKIKVNPKIIKTEKIHKLALERYNSLSKEEKEKLEEEFNYWGNTSFRKYIDYRTKKNLFIDMKMVNEREQYMI